MTLEDSIRHKALELGFSECRYTSADPPEAGQLRAFDQWLDAGKHAEMEWIRRGRDKRHDPQLVLPGARSVICLAVNYLGSHQSPAGPAHAGDNDAVVARYAHYQDYHDWIAERLKNLSDFVDRETGVGSRSLWYVDTGPILERSFAMRAGVGFTGKHTGLISRRGGNWFFLAEILTQAALVPDKGERNRCGSCTRCLSACPTGALPEPFQLDARRCISYLTIEHKGPIPDELRPLMGTRVFGCDDCLQVCPWNRFAAQSNQVRKFLRQDIVDLPLEKWLELGEESYRQLTRGTPMFRTRRSRMLRNVCIAMGNSGQEKYRKPLMEAAGDSDPLVAEHAVWAVGRLESAADQPGKSCL